MPTPEPPPIRSTEEVERQQVVEWEKWLDTLSPDARAEVESKFTAPEPPKKRRRPREEEDDDEHVSLGTCDDLASPLPTPDQALDAKWAEAQRGGWERVELELLNHVLPTIADSGDPRREASYVALALGDVAACQGITVAAVAERHHVPVDMIQGKVRALAVKFGVCRADLKLLRYVMAPILASRSPGLEAETIAKAARIGLSNADRMEDVGQKHGVCRAAISRRVRVWCKKLGLPLPRECKQNTDAYKLFNVTRKPFFDLGDGSFAPDPDEN